VVGPICEVFQVLEPGGSDTTASLLRITSQVEPAVALRRHAVVQTGVCVTGQAVATSLE